MATNHRASLLSGLRTGGVRSTSNTAHLQTQGPYTSAIGGQFPRYASGEGYGGYGDDSQIADHMQTLHLNAPRHGAMPMTASAVDGVMPQFQQQQSAQAMYLQAQAQAMQRAMMGGSASMTPDQQVLQMQMDFLKLQQQQQFQAQMLAQAQQMQQIQQQQQQQQAQQQRRRPSEPATAGPLTTSFPGSVLSRSRLPSTVAGGNADMEYPMTAALDGRFGVRSTSGLNPNAAAFKVTGENTSSLVPPPSATSGNWRSGNERTGTAPPANTPATPSFTTVISGGTSLGTPSTATFPQSIVAPSPAKHDTVSSWRRPSVPSSKLTRSTPSPPNSRSPSASPPTVFISTPEDEEPLSLPIIRGISPPAAIAVKARPQPLRFTVPVTNHQTSEGANGNEQVVTFTGSDEEVDEDDSQTPTPTTGSSGHSVAREEASKRLYEGLGIGRPVPQALMAAPIEPAVLRQASFAMQPARQPRGPPSGVEDLGPRNFASRIRRKAIGGLGALMDARGRRDGVMEVEVY